MPELDTLNRYLLKLTVWTMAQNTLRFNKVHARRIQRIEKKRVANLAHQIELAIEAEMVFKMGLDKARFYYSERYELDNE